MPNCTDGLAGMNIGKSIAIFCPLPTNQLDKDLKRESCGFFFLYMRETMANAGGKKGMLRSYVGR